MEWMTVSQTAKLWGISTRWTAKLCEKGKVEGAQKLGNFWLVPKCVSKPIDGRTKTAKQTENIRLTP